MLVYESKVIACQIYAVFPLRPADQSTLGSTAHSLSFLQRRGGGGDYSRQLWKYQNNWLYGHNPRPVWSLKNRNIKTTALPLGIFFFTMDKTNNK